uniref:Uncharacterized protein n=1 Tax=Arundo donax TaxID=35708 RepID=A0A0A9EPA5_ARUDO
MVQHVKVSKDKTTHCLTLTEGVILYYLMNTVMLDHTYALVFMHAWLWPIIFVCGDN